MAHKLIRIYGRGHLHFIAFTCYRRLSWNGFSFYSKLKSRLIQFDPAH